MLRILVVTILIVATAGCAETSQKTALAEFQRGIVVRSGDQFVLRPCYVSNELVLQDDSGALGRWFKQAPVEFEQVYAEMMLTADTLHPGSSRIDELLLVGSQPRGCEFELHGNHYRAAGENPLWIADIRDEGIRVHVRGSLRQLLFPPVEPDVNGRTLTWRSTLEVQEGYSVNLKMIREACYDRFGTLYPYSASISVYGMTFEGCGRRGDLARSSIAATYIYSDGVLSLMAVLEPDGNLAFTDLRQGETSSVATYLKGRWRLLETGRLQLELERESGTRQVLFLERMNDGALRLKFGHKAYREGLLLRRQ
ncbi:hypothetical protein QKW35_14635 [Pontibacterium granulatum]|uniref:hypothetical protein n=1 Tax=Pontibacterium granulatum TaxID=2036029 RepID=UPI002499C775|nr:hypothetical protein [Pontibacterium granulatum]MDI3325612.1 hypothetical protein [Pontibacterium granulatum]